MSCSGLADGGDDGLLQSCRSAGLSGTCFQIAPFCGNSASLKTAENLRHPCLLLTKGLERNGHGAPCVSAGTRKGDSTSFRNDGRQCCRRQSLKETETPHRDMSSQNTTIQSHHMLRASTFIHLDSCCCFSKGCCRIVQTLVQALRGSLLGIMATQNGWPRRWL